MKFYNSYDIMDQIKKEHILNAIAEIDKEGIRPGYTSSFYDLIYNGKKYPPKFVVILANKYATGEELDRKKIRSGPGKPAYNLLEKYGFEIIKKSNNNTMNLTETYLKEFAQVAEDWFAQQTWLEERYNYFQNFFIQENLEKAKWKDFQEMGNNIHAFVNMQIAKGKALGRINLDGIEDYRRIFKYIVSEKDPVNVIINNIESDGSTYKLPYFGDSAISELIAYAYPDQYVTYNTRDMQALEILGLRLPKVRKEKFGEKFLRYNELLEPILQQYIEIVGQRTNTSIPLELDQFFSWLYESKKNDKPIIDMIARYKEHIIKNGLDDEKYKWEMIRDQLGHPNVEADDFVQEVYNIDFQNLAYYQAKTVRHLVDDDQEFTRGLFKSLFDEDNLIEDRVKKFIDNSKKRIDKIMPGKSSGQDERTMSVYLTLHDPEKYAFYKSSYYLDYCKLIDEKPARSSKKKYPDYLERLKSLSENYISKDKELLSLVSNNLGDLVNFDPNFLLLGQDILFQVSVRELNQNYWVFQGNSDKYDFHGSIKNNEQNEWSVNAHKDEIRKGDKIIFWLTGNYKGCYALGEVSTEVKQRKDDESEDNLMTGVVITHNLIETPITFKDISQYEELKDLNVSIQGTNFSATKQEYDKLLDISEDRLSKQYWLYQPGENALEWNEFYESGIMGIGWDELGDLKQYKTRTEIKNGLMKFYGGDGSKKNDVSANDDFINKVNIGDVIIVKKGRKELLGYGAVTSDYFIDPKRSSYKSCRKVDWKLKGSWHVDFNMVVKTLTDITRYPSKEEQYSTYYNRLLGIMGQDYITEVEKKMVIPTNQILFGPPGTGKTFKLKDEYFEKYTTRESAITKQMYFESMVKDLSWWQILGITLIDLEKAKVSEILTNKWVVEKIKTSESENVRPIIWSQLQHHTIHDCPSVKLKKRSAPGIFCKTEDSYWEISKEDLMELAPELNEIKERVENFIPDSAREIKRYKFTTFHQSFSYEDFIEGIKPIMLDEDEESADLSYSIQPGVFKQLCTDAQNDPDNKYAIFIDEINRGNVSNIFGELITLIEADKRKGARNELSAILPYSKKKFSVPLNVDIYGTMNTADRSVEALDTALRRRFSFQEIIPNPEIIKLEGKNNGIVEINNGDSIDLVDLLSKINERIEVLIDRDHTIGHSYFLEVGNLEELKMVFKDKIIPLLQEYFYGDYGKIGLVLGNGFVTYQPEKSELFANFDNYERKDELNNGFYILKIIDEKFDLTSAINELLNIKIEEREES